MQPYFSGLVRNSSDFTCTTSLTDIPGLSFSLVAGGIYRFSVDAQWRSTTTTAAQIVVVMGGTVVPANISYDAVLQISQVASYSPRAVGSFSDGPSVALSASAAEQNHDYAVRISGSIVVGTSGTLTVAAQRGTTSGSNAVVRSGGIYTLEQLA